MLNKANKNKRNKRRKLNENQHYKLTTTRNYTGSDFARLTFLDPHRYITLKYVDTFSVSLTASTGGQQIYNLNSLFDPDRTGTGHQPYGFDQMAALYNRYRVLRTGYRIVVSASSPFGLLVLPLNGLLSAAITTAATFATAAENPRAKVWQVGPTGNSKIISGNISLNDLNGCLLEEYLADDRFESQVAASPSEIIVLYIGYINSSAAATIGVYYTVELFFEVDFHDPISLAGS